MDQGVQVTEHSSYADKNIHNDKKGVSMAIKRILAWAEGIWESLDRKTGPITLAGTGAVLNVPENFYYLDAADSEKILVEVWGNPPGQTTLGMLFPADTTPFDEASWAVTIQYEEDGYVSDEDAAEIDYGALLDDMKKDTQAESEARVEALLKRLFSRKKA